MRAAQGIEDKHEARREIKVSTSGEYKGVDASANTIHINRAQFQYASLLVYFRERGAKERCSI
jgi:hypothetical protein